MADEEKIQTKEKSKNFDRGTLIQKLIDSKLSVKEIQGIFKNLGQRITVEEIQRYPRAPGRHEPPVPASSQKPAEAEKLEPNPPEEKKSYLTTSKPYQKPLSWERDQDKMSEATKEAMRDSIERSQRKQDERRSHLNLQKPLSWERDQDKIHPQAKEAMEAFFEREKAKKQKPIQTPLHWSKDQTSMSPETREAMQESIDRSQQRYDERTSNLPKPERTGAPTYADTKEAVEKGRKEAIEQIINSTGDPTDIIRQSGDTIKGALDDLASQFKEASSNLSENIKSNTEGMVGSLDSIYEELQKQSLDARLGGVSSGGAGEEEINPETKPEDGDNGKLFSILSNVLKGVPGAAAVIAGGVGTMLSFLAVGGVAGLAFIKSDRKHGNKLRSFFRGLFGISDTPDDEPEGGKYFWEKDTEAVTSPTESQSDRALRNIQEHQAAQESNSERALRKIQEHQAAQTGGVWEWITDWFKKKEEDHTNVTTDIQNTLSLEAENTITFTANELIFKKQNSDEAPDMDDTGGKPSAPSAPSPSSSSNDVYEPETGARLTPDDGVSPLSKGLGINDIGKFAVGGMAKYDAPIAVSAGEQIKSKFGQTQTIPGTPNKQDNIVVQGHAGDTITPQQSMHDMAAHNENLLRPGVRSSQSIEQALQSHPQWGIPEGQSRSGMEGLSGGKSMFGTSLSDELKGTEAQIERSQKAFTGELEDKYSKEGNYVGKTAPLAQQAAYVGGPKSSIPSSDTSAPQTSSKGSLSPAASDPDERRVKGSYYSSIPGRADWPTDKGDMDKQGNPLPSASGVPLARPGIALPSRESLANASNPALSKLFEITDPTGQKQSGIPQVDLGPGKWTGRGVDINAPLADQMGYQAERKGATNPFPTDSYFNVRKMSEEEAAPYRNPEFGGPPESADSNVPQSDDLTPVNNTPNPPDPPDDKVPDQTGDTGQDSVPPYQPYSSVPGGGEQNDTPQQDNKQDQQKTDMPDYSDYSNVP